MVTQVFSWQTQLPSPQLFTSSGNSKDGKKKKEVSIKAVCKPKKLSNLRKISEDDYADSRELYVCVAASGLEKQYEYMLDLP